MSRFLRFAFVALASMLTVGALAGCDSESLDDVEAPEVDLDPGDDEGEPPSDGGNGGTPGGAGDDTSGTGEPAALDDGGPLGGLGPNLLDPSVPGAEVEIDNSEGVGLTGSARDALADRLSEHGGKEVAFAGADTIRARDTWSNTQLRSAAREHRSTSSTTASVSVHVLVVSGEHEDGRVLGVALDASTFAVFPEAIRGGLLSGLSGDDVEVSVAVHELGHLFGLVDLTGEGGFHEDPDHPNHSASEESVMHWAIETDAISQIFNGPPPTAFDGEDRQEMERIRT